MWVVGILTNLEPEGSRLWVSALIQVSIDTSAMSGNPASPQIPENSSPPSSPSHWLAQGSGITLLLTPGTWVPGMKWSLRGDADLPAGSLLYFQGLTLYSYHLWVTNHLVKANNSYSISCLCSLVEQNRLLPESPSTWAKETKIFPIPMFLLKKLLLHSWAN